MQITPKAPAGWDESIAFPMLSTSFARASGTMGLSPLYATDGMGRALILLRALPGPLIRWWTTRARVYVDAPHSSFVPALIDALRARGVSYVRLGDGAWGLPASAGTTRGMVPVTTHLMLFDATIDEATALARLEPKTRSQLRKALREGVTTDEVRTAEALAAFCSIVAETRERMRSQNVAAAMPESFYRAVFKEMVPRGEAVLLLARAGDTPLAGGLFFLSKERMTYYHGGSTRDRALTALNGPTALFWHAMRLAHARGNLIFDLGAVTPSDDPAHPNRSVYYFKRGFGGTVEPLHGAEIVLAPARWRFQERVVLPAWKRMYPWYLAMIGGRAA